MGSGGSLGSRCRAHSQAQSVTPAHSQRSGSAGSAVGSHSIHSQATKNGEVLSSKSDSSQGEGVGTKEEDNAEEGKSGIKTSSDEQEVSDGEDQQECPHTQDTLTGVSQLFSEHEDTDPESDSGEKVQTARQKQHKDSPKKDSSGSSSSEESRQPMRCSETELGKKRGCLTHTLMLGIATKFPTMLWAGRCKIP